MMQLHLFHFKSLFYNELKLFINLHLIPFLYLLDLRFVFLSFSYLQLIFPRLVVICLALSRAAVSGCCEAAVD